MQLIMYNYNPSVLWFLPKFIVILSFDSGILESTPRGIIKILVLKTVVNVLNFITFIENNSWRVYFSCNI